jgi:hypothetical protein
MAGFSVRAEQIDLPRGAYHKAPRTCVTWNDRTVLGFSQNDHRAYLFPVCTPAGLPVTTETPTDHPHHNSVWIGADHVTALLPFAENLYEEATYSFYINETFQGRAPGRIISRSIQHAEPAANHLQLVQTIDWIGPVEWGAADGRVIAEETRTVDIFPAEDGHTIDLHSQLAPTQWDLRIGPTRHAYFGVRVIEPLRPGSGGSVVDSEGRTGTSAIRGQTGHWIHLTGEALADHHAGLVICRDAAMASQPWSLHDWGTVDVNPLGQQAHLLEAGETLACRLRLIAHDGTLTPEQVEQRCREFLDG